MQRAICDGDVVSADEAFRHDLRAIQRHGADQQTGGPAQLGDGALRDQPTFADDPDAIAGLLDLPQ